VAAAAAVRVAAGQAVAGPAVARVAAAQAAAVPAVGVAADSAIEVAGAGAAAGARDSGPWNLLFAQGRHMPHKRIRRLGKRHHSR
jgi:hypothetical protein